MANTEKLVARAYAALKNPNGDVVSDSEVGHVSAISRGLIDRMDLKESDAGSNSIPSAAFSKPGRLSDHAPGLCFQAM